MNIVGHLKKGSKGWALTQNTITGHYNVGYTGYGDLEGTAEKIRETVDKAKAEFADLVSKHGSKPEELPYPSGIRSFHDKSTPPEEKKAWEDYNYNRSVRYLWDNLQRKANCVVHEKHPIFEDVLVFKGYTRGRSSVTLEFYASNGQTIAFGPAGIDALLTSIINGTVTLVDATGREIDPANVKNETTGLWDKVPQFHAGNGIKARFVFEKKGQNIYANTVFKE